MEVVRLSEAKPYESPGHFDMRGLRLQGHEASGAESFWVGLSNFLPGGGAEMDGTPIEKVYVVVEGEVTIVTEEGDRWFLEDRGSFNGTFLNGQRIQAGAKVPLRHGDRIGFGAESVVFSAPESLVDPEVTTALQTGAPASF